jgi:RHS repeat-associated protein
VYDAVSNRTSQVTTGAGAGSVGYTYDSRDRLMSEGGTAYGWTDNGNLMSKEGNSYEWDFEDRLTRVVKGDGTVVENVYDMDGVMVKTVVTLSGGTAQTTDLLVDTSGGLSHVVAEVDGIGAVTAMYVRAGDMLLEEIRGGAAKMYEADGLGSVRGLLDVSGARTDAYSYEAFGSTLSSTGTDENPYRFAGERFVDEIGMYQNRARWLDTGVGRFVSVDPISGQRRNPITLQPYLYGNESPISYIDPTGKFSDGLIGVMTITAQVSILGAFAYASLNNYANTARGGMRKETLAEISKYREIRIAWGDPPGSVDFDTGVANLIRHWWKNTEEQDIEEAHYTAATFRNISYGVSQDIRVCAAERYITGLIQARNWVVKDGYWPGQVGLYNLIKRTIGPSYLPPFGFYPPSPYSPNASNWYNEGRSGFGGQQGIVPPVRCWNFFDYAHQRYWNFDQGPGFAPVSCQ